MPHLKQLDNKQYADAVYFCQKCGNRTTYIHDLKCVLCDNQSIVYCPNCLTHFKVIDE